MSHGRAGLLAALFAISLALRPQIVGIGPLLPEIQVDLDVSHAVAGLLATIPVLCMGVFAPPSAHLAGRIGSRAAIGAAIALIGIAGLARAFAPGAAGVLLLTFPVGIGIAVAGTLLPVAVKERFGDRPAFATGMYATGINAGSTLAAAAAVPLAALGSWRTALAVFSGVTVGLALLWILQTRREPPHQPLDVRPPKLPVRSGVAWVLVVMFGLLGTTFYGLSAWLPDSFVERGWSEESAGALLAVMQAVSIPGSLVVSAVADRFGSRRLYLVGASALLVMALIGIVLAPDAGWAWAAAAGLAIGSLFALTMTLPLDVADDPLQVGAVAGLMLGAGYLISALSPLVLGAIRDASGSFTGSLWLMVGTTLVFLVLGSTLTRERLRRGVPSGVPAAR
jgi:CP family cyanate transporter-like MFS transporter